MHFLSCFHLHLVLKLAIDSNVCPIIWRKVPKKTKTKNKMQNNENISNFVRHIPFVAGQIGWNWFFPCGWKSVNQWIRKIYSHIHTHTQLLVFSMISYRAVIDICYVHKICGIFSVYGHVMLCVCAVVSSWCQHWPSLNIRVMPIMLIVGIYCTLYTINISVLLLLLFSPTVFRLCAWIARSRRDRKTTWTIYRQYPYRSWVRWQCLKTETHH